MTDDQGDARFSDDIVIASDSGQPILTIHGNGRIEVGAGYQPDEAAEAFWEAVWRLQDGLRQARIDTARLHANDYATSRKD